MLDNNLAMDRYRIDYIARLPHGESMVRAALNRAEPIIVDDLEHRFGVEQILAGPQTDGFLASLLYFFGVVVGAQWSGAECRPLERLGPAAR